MARDDSTLPRWIPDRAREIYTSTGPYSDFRREGAIHDLFHDSNLEALFRQLDGDCLSGDEWGHLIGYIVNAVECVPEFGFATADAPDFKLDVRNRQAEADEILSRIGKMARELAGLLEGLDCLGAVAPAETYSSLALLESALVQNVAQEDFLLFRKSLSSYRRRGFPPPALLLNVLAESVGAHPSASKIFNDDIWLGSSQKSSWKDFVRILAAGVAEMREIYGTRISLRNANVLALVRALINPNVDDESIRKAISKSALFSPGRSEK